jgi:ribose transport system permease protein
MDNPGLAQQDGLKAGDHGWIGAYKRRLLGPAALQKLLAFASLVLLPIYFSFASPAFMQTDNMINIMQATAGNGVLAIASTVVIITGGIDLSVGTLMTFCAVVAGVFLTYWELPMWTGIIAAIAAGALSGGVSGTLIAKMKIPPFIATLGMMQVLKGLSLVVSGDKPIYFSNTESFSMISQDSLLGNVMPGLPIPNAVLILFVLAILAAVVLNRTSLGRTPSPSVAMRKRCASPASASTAGKSSPTVSAERSAALPACCSPRASIPPSRRSARAMSSTRSPRWSSAARR